MKHPNTMTVSQFASMGGKARWSGKTAEARRREMSALAKARWAKTVRKPKRAARLPNAAAEARRTGDVDCK